LERLAEGPVIGDGGFVFQLEKRGYVKVRLYTVLGLLMAVVLSVFQHNSLRVHAVYVLVCPLENKLFLR
jgi:hypothetical protein